MIGAKEIRRVGPWSVELEELNTRSWRLFIGCRIYRCRFDMVVVPRLKGGMRRNEEE
jgi:hypothetical protein